VPASSHEQLKHALATLRIDDLIAMGIPERELLLDPILPAKGLMMIHAKRGGSKTFLGAGNGAGGSKRDDPPSLVSVLRLAESSTSTAR
jgi:hypothetical protein